MRLGKWTLALAALLILGGTAMAQIDANRICIMNGSDYYVGSTGWYPSNSLNDGTGKYYPSFSHWSATTSSGGAYDWQIRGWAWTGMQANITNQFWYWGTMLAASLDNPWQTTMTWDYPVLFCTGAVPSSGPPWVVYGTSGLNAALGSVFAGKEYVFPSSYGGFDPYLNIFATGATTWNIPSTAPFYGWNFGFSLPAASAINIPSNNSIYQYTYENFGLPLGLVGQYQLLSGNEIDCTLGGGGNKGRNYVLGNVGDSPYFFYWNNSGGGGDVAWAMCLFVEDAVTIPVNVPGASNASNPYAYAGYAFDHGTATVTPFVSSGSAALDVTYENYAGAGTGYALLAGSPWLNGIPFGTPVGGTVYGPAGNRVPLTVDVFTNFFISINFVWLNPNLQPGFPACLFGTTTGGVGGAFGPISIPPDPALFCYELRYCGFSSAGQAPTASFMVTCF